MGDKKCVYTLLDKWAVTAASADTFDETSDKTATLHSDMDASCPAFPSNLTPHSAKTVKYADYVSNKLKALKELLDLDHFKKTLSWAKDVKLVTSRRETLDIDGVTVSVLHLIVDANDPIKELLQIHIHDPSLSVLHLFAGLLHRTVGRASRAKAVAGIRESGIKDRVQNLSYCLPFH